MDPDTKFSLHSNGVVGFESTWNADKEVMVRDAGQQTEKENLKKDQDQQTAQSQDSGNQTEVFTNKDVPCDDKKLAEFLKKIFPSLMDELDLGVTEVFGEEAGETRQVKVIKHQTIDLNKICGVLEVRYDEVMINKLMIYDLQDDAFIQDGSLCWLSVLTQNAPLLVVSGCSSKTDHKNASVSIFEPTK